MITLKNLSFQYSHTQVKVLDRINLTVNEGCLFGLLGPNGAGKTTLISILTGSLLHDIKNGSISIAGNVLPNALNITKKLIGYIPQEYAFYPNLTALENLQFFAGVQNLKGINKTQRIQHCLSFCQLESVATKKATEFSGGLKRRLNIAIGLLMDPPILIFDEPTVSIDPQSRAFILKQIKALQQEGKTIIYTSHYMDEVEQICDSLAIIDQGKVLTQGTVQQLKQQQTRQLIVDCDKPVDESTLSSITNAVFNNHQLIFDDVSDLSACNKILQEVATLGISVSGISYGKNPLEKIFLNLTDSALRD